MLPLAAEAGEWPCAVVEKAAPTRLGGTVIAHRLICDVSRAERETKRDAALARCERLSDEVDAGGCAALVRRSFEARERAMARRALRAGLSAEEVASRLALSPADLAEIEAALAAQAAPVPEAQPDEQRAAMEQRQAEMLDALAAMDP